MLASGLSSPGGRGVLTWPYIVGTDIQAEVWCLVEIRHLYLELR